jgi:hypothetical protein
MQWNTVQYYYGKCGNAAFCVMDGDQWSYGIASPQCRS